jgi:hypothetical protein
MTTLEKVKQDIKNKSNFISNIANTYSSIYKACMEYIDNSIDSAYDKNIKNAKIEVHLYKDKIQIIDNCGGMSPLELGKLVSNIGEQKERKPWTNGLFTFGINAGRAFVKKIEFQSRKEGYEEATIVIRDDIKDDETVEVKEAENKYFTKNNEYGTIVTLYEFKKNNLKGRGYNFNNAYENFYKEIQEHFSEVIRKGKVKIRICYFGKLRNGCKDIVPIDYESIEGKHIKEDIPLMDSSNIQKGVIHVNIVISEKKLFIEPGIRIIVKDRQLNFIHNLNSYKRFLEEKKDNIDIWKGELIAGYIDLNVLEKPIITRDDLDTNSDTITQTFEIIYNIQKKIKEVEDKIKNEKNMEKYKTFSNVISEYITKFFNQWKIPNYKLLPSTVLFNDQQSKNGFQNSKETGTPNPRGDYNIEKKYSENRNDKDGGDGGNGGHNKFPEKGDKDEKGKEIVLQQAPTTPEKIRGLEITFEKFEGNPNRVIDSGDRLSINTEHNDFITHHGKDSIENIEKGVHPQFISYISLILSPYLIKRKIEKNPTEDIFSPIIMGEQIINLSIDLENYLIQQFQLNEVSYNDGK